MPLFGFRKDKKHEQSHIQATAELAKSNAAADKGKARGKTARKTISEKPEKISAEVVSKKALVGKPDESKQTPALPSGTFSNASEAVIRPHVTEKSGMLAQGGVYTFEVTQNANKEAVRKAVAALYKVTPVKVGILNSYNKRIVVKGRRGSVAGVRKAVVTVKKGEKIDFV